MQVCRTVLRVGLALRVFARVTLIVVVVAHQDGKMEQEEQSHSHHVASFLSLAPLLLSRHQQVNLKDEGIVFGDAGKSTGNDYFA